MLSYVSSENGFCVRLLIGACLVGPNLNRSLFLFSTEIYLLALFNRVLVSRDQSFHLL